MKVTKLPFASVITNHPCTLFRDRTAALAVACANAADESDGWIYRVVEWPGNLYAVQVFDSKNLFLGTL